MTAAGPLQPGEGPGDESGDVPDYDAMFAAIVSPLSDQMNWDAVDEIEAAAAQLGAAEEAARVEAEAVAKRAVDRDRRRAERAAELAEYTAEKAAIEAEYNSDDDHFTPPAPPPLPRLRPATVGAVLLMIGGIVLIARPTLLSVGQELTIVVGLLVLVGGCAALISGMRKSHDDGDTGAVL